MSSTSCKKCNGTGFIENKNVLFCKNNTLKLSYHLCYLCENNKFNFNSKWILCYNCHGDGYFIKNDSKTFPSF